RDQDGSNRQPRWSDPNDRIADRGPEDDARRDATEDAMRRDRPYPQPAFWPIDADRTSHIRPTRDVSDTLAPPGLRGERSPEPTLLREWEIRRCAAHRGHRARRLTTGRRAPVDVSVNQSRVGDAVDVERCVDHSGHRSFHATSTFSCETSPPVTI